MTICYFGDYDPEYSRNRVIIKGLRANGVTVFECNARTAGLKKYNELFKKHRTLGKYDAMIVGYSNDRWLVFFAKCIARAPVVWDAFYSVYDMWINDRKLVSRISIKALYYWISDQVACMCASKILLDTNAHIDYFLETFFVKKDKFERVLVGTDDEVFFPKETKKETDQFRVHFHGKFIPLQGVPYIIEAAALVEKEGIIFHIIGRGQDYKKVRELAEKRGVRNIEWIDRVPYNELAVYMQRADMCLGVFGDTEKTLRVIPNKVYEAVAMAKPLITADTPAIRELFTHKKDIYLCEKANAQSIADAIVELKENTALRNEIAKGGHEVFQKNAATKIIGNLVKSVFESLI